MGYFFRPHIYHTIGSNIEAMKALDKVMNFGKHYRLEWCAEGYDDPTWRSWGYFIHTEHYEEFINKIFTIKGTIKGECLHFRNEKNTAVYAGGDTYNDSTIWSRKYSDNYSYFTNKEVLKYVKLMETDDTIVGECSWTSQHKGEMKRMREDDSTIKELEEYDDKYDPIKEGRRQLIYILKGPWEDWCAW
jgi:hypothetical protein